MCCPSVRCAQSIFGASVGSFQHQKCTVSCRTPASCASSWSHGDRRTVQVGGGGAPRFAGCVTGAGAHALPSGVPCIRRELDASTLIGVTGRGEQTDRHVDATLRRSHKHWLSIVTLGFFPSPLLQTNLAFRYDFLRKQKTMFPVQALAGRRVQGFKSGFS